MDSIVHPTLKKDFIASHIVSYTDGIPKDWALEPGIFYYSLDLKMMNLPGLVYGFHWNDQAKSSQLDGSVPSRSTDKDSSLTAIDKPWRIVTINLSMNDLTRLHHEALKPFSQLRLLDASLNRIDNLVGLEICRELRHLALSHNSISNLEGLHGCPHLTNLDLSVNFLLDLSRMPSLPALTKLNINNNKLKSLNGLQALPRLAELHAEKNHITDTIALAGSFHLRLLNLGDNDISSLRLTIETLTGLSKLEAVILQGNPISMEGGYRDGLKDAVSSLISVDHDLVRVNSHQVLMASSGLQEPGTLGRQVALKAAARRVYMDQLADHKRLLANNICYYNKKISDLQKEYQEYERNLQKELASCMSYIDTLTLDDPNRCGKNIPNRQDWPWLNFKGLLKESWDVLEHGGPVFSNANQKSPKLEHAGVRDTDEVLRLASNQLANLRKN